MVKSHPKLLVVVLHPLRQATITGFPPAS